MTSTRPTQSGLSPSDAASAWEFKGCIPRSTCVLKDGSIVTLVTSPVGKNTSITLCSIKSPTREIIKKNIPLQEPDACRFIFAIGHFILVAGEERGYLFNADLELQSCIQEVLIPDLFVVWDESRFIIAKPSDRLRLYDVTETSNPRCSEILINEAHQSFGLGTSLVKLMDYLVICDEFDETGCRDARELTFYSLNSSLTEGICQYENNVSYKTGQYLDRRIVGLLPDTRIAEISTHNLFPKNKDIKPPNKLNIFIDIHTKNTTHSSPSKYNMEERNGIIWELPHEEQDFQLYKDFSNLISIVNYSILFLRRSGIAVYDLQNNIQYQIAFPMNFCATGMVVWNDKLIMYNQTSLYQYQFTALPSIREEIQGKTPILPMLIHIIIDYLNNDIKLSTHPATIFSHQIPRLIDTSEFIPSRCNLM